MEFIWAPVFSCTHWLRPRNPPTPAFGLIYEGAMGQPRYTTSLSAFIEFSWLGSVPFNCVSVLCVLSPFPEPIPFSLSPNLSWKGQCHEIFHFCFFHESVSPKPLSIPLGPFWIFLKICRDIRSSRCTTCVVDTGGKWKKSSIINVLIIFFGHLWDVELT